MVESIGTRILALMVGGGQCCRTRVRALDEWQGCSGVT